MIFDVLEIDGLVDAGLLIEVHQVALEVWVIQDAPQAALEVDVINKIKAHQGAKEAPVGFDDSVAEEIALCREAQFQLIERFEKAARGALIGGLAGGEAGAINTIVYSLIDELGERGLFVRNLSRKEVDFPGGELAERFGKHPADVVFGVIDDAIGLFVPKDRHGDAVGEVRIGRAVGLGEVGEPVDRVAAVSGTLAKGPATLVAHRIDHSHADRVFEPE